jgi:glycosyltransferase involved in cell wall biosynthesis
MFNFLKYINPGSYYRLIHLMPQAILLDNLCFVDDNINHYKLSKSIELDLLYQRLLCGEIPLATQERNDIQNERIFNVHDNYVFTRRFFSLFQLFYVLIIRLCSFKNPINEILGFLYAAFKVRRISIHPYKYEDWFIFESKLILEKPLVSVLIPTLNRYDYLKDVLLDLEGQDYKNFEVIVVDQSEPINTDFYKGWNLNIKLIHQAEKALWLARNTAISRANGQYIALTEDDVRMRADWISNHLKCLDYFHENISAGIFHPLSSKINLDESASPFFKISQQFPTGNVLLNKTIFNKVGLFDRQFEGQRMGDGEFGLRCCLNGFRVISNPIAFIIDVKAPIGGLRQMGSWDALRPKSLFSPRPVPSVLYLFRNYFGNSEAIFYIIKNIPFSYMPYKFKKNKLMSLAFILLFPFYLPIAVFAVLKSWNLASDKVKVGPLITQLN